MTRQHFFPRCRRVFTALSLASAFIVLRSAPAQAAGILVQPEVLISRTASTIDQSQDEIFDVLQYTSLVIQVKVHEENITANKWVKVHLQTGNTLSTQDYKTIQSVVFDKTSDTAPDVWLEMVSIDSATPLGRYLRWQAEFEDPTSSQWFTFSAVAVGRN
ncbi:MAG: hypothetical protein CME06_16875 [Gemmatimonadetes bacterium]|nr:hypothetical protein [Gemmatimonadota bacterium]